MVTLIFCPCVKCENTHCWKANIVWKHLYTRGIFLNYYVWVSHEEVGQTQGEPDEVGEEDDPEI